MTRWKVILAAFIIFVAGAATGGVLVHSYAPPPQVPKNQVRQGPFNGDHRRGYLQRLDKELQLTTEQHDKIEKILADSQERMRKLWEPVSPKAKEEYAATRKEISEVLTPEQREKMKNMRRTWDRDKNGHERQNHDSTMQTNDSQKVEEKPQSDKI